MHGLQSDSMAMLNKALEDMSSYTWKMYDNQWTVLVI